MSKTIKLNETSLVCNKSKIGNALCWSNDDTEVLHPHPYPWPSPEIVVLKRWKPEEILDPDGPINYSKFWTEGHGIRGPFWRRDPNLWVQKAGFVYEGAIDLKELFGDFSKKDVKNTSFFSVSRDKKVTPFTWLPRTWRDLRKVRDELEAELDKFGYKDRKLILYRSINTGFGNWDVISVFSEKRVPVGN